MGDGIFYSGIVKISGGHLDIGVCGSELRTDVCSREKFQSNHTWLVIKAMGLDGLT